MSGIVAYGRNILSIIWQMVSPILANIFYLKILLVITLKSRHYTKINMTEITMTYPQNPYMKSLRVINLKNRHYAKMNMNKIRMTNPKTLDSCKNKHRSSLMERKILRRPIWDINSG
jgi:hypothetical protein